MSEERRMRAMVLNEVCQFAENRRPLTLVHLPEPEPGVEEVLLKVSTCGVCHTELDEIEGRTPPPELPTVLGHQVVGRVVGNGTGAVRFSEGDRVGVGWIHSSCGACKLCLRGDENLCQSFRATGRDHHGGYAEYMKVPERFAHPIPELFSDVQAAPLLCAGAIGYRSLRLSNLADGGRLGLTGFGASGHLVLKMVRHRYPSTDVYVFARSEKEREFAKELGAVWAGGTTETAPQKLDAIIDTTPVWKRVMEALRNVDSGGRLIINAIRKEDVDKDAWLELDYPRHLWMEKEIKSVANVASRDIVEFLELAAEIPIEPETQEYALEDANVALCELKERKIRGAKVLVVS